MAKISPVASKYTIIAKINIDGIVDRPDVIGAIFGQTEGLLGNDLELRELQRSGRIGRIEVNVDVEKGKTNGEIIIPSSLDKTETAIVGAALEIIDRIGPCESRIEVQSIKDVRISKRTQVIKRAKELLRKLTEDNIPETQEIAEEVSNSVRMMEVEEYGKDKLPAGPAIKDSEEIVVVEGRADVLNLLKHGFKNAIAMNGSSIPETIKTLSKHKTITMFVDGDRGGDLNVREGLSVAEIDFVCKAPDGKEVEELTKKEIHKALRGKITAEQAKLEFTGSPNRIRTQTFSPIENKPRPVNNNGNSNNNNSVPKKEKSLPANEKKIFKETLDDLIGTRGACIFDNELNIMGKVPLSELASTIKSLNNVHALVIDGVIDKDLVILAEKTRIKNIVGKSNKVKDSRRVSLYTEKEL
jgi:DNA primase